jgi:hypothetical protein
MSDKLTSIDEFLSHHKDFVKSGDVLLKASRSSSSWDPEKRSMRFVMSAEVEDRDRDIVYQDGLSIDEFLKNPVGFFNHRSYDRPHGKWSDIEKINGRPKRTEGTFTCAPEGINPVADALAADMGADLIRACSIGFRPKAVKKREIPEDKKDLPYYWPGYDILEAELLECSPCTIPSNPAALAKAASGGNTLARELIEEVLDNWAKSPAGLLVPRAEFDAAYKDATGNRTVVVVVGEGSAPNAEMIKDAVTKALNNETPADEDPSTGDDHQKTADQAGAKDDAGAAKTVVLDRNQAVTDSVTGKTMAEPPSEPPEDWYGTLSGLPAEKKGSFLQWLMKLFGSNAESHFEQELRAKSAADEAEEQARKDALEARRKELQTRFQSISTRVEEKGLV